MAIMDVFSQHQDYAFFALAGVCLIIELSILGLSGPLLFIALGSLVAGLSISVGLVHDFGVALVVLAITALVSAVALWGPLKRFQNKTTTTETSSDMVGKVLPVTARITHIDGRVSYSGVEWLAQLDEQSTEAIDINQRVTVTGVRGTCLLVRAVD